MDAVTVLRLLWRQRLLLAVGMGLAVVVGIVMAYNVTGFPPKFANRQYEVGIASAEMLVDSQSSQVADLGGGQALTDVTGLAGRAQLLANLMAISPLKERIARRAGVNPRRLVASAPSVDLPKTKNALDATSDGRTSTTLTIGFNEVLPIITANAQAPTPEIAARISTAAVDELKIYLKTLAATDKVPDARQLVISPLGPARFATVARGPRRLFAMLAAIFVFGLWSVGLVFGTRLARSWRRAAAEERSQGSTRPRPADRVAAVPDRAAHAHSGGFDVPQPPVASSQSSGPQRLPELPELPVASSQSSGPQPLPELAERPERPRRGAVA
jgi:hypothetical protein